MYNILDLKKFQNDVYDMAEKLSRTLDDNGVPKLNLIRHNLIELYKANLVKN